MRLRPPGNPQAAARLVALSASLPRSASRTAGGPAGPAVRAFALGLPQTQLLGDHLVDFGQKLSQRLFACSTAATYGLYATVSACAATAPHPPDRRVGPLVLCA